jgi:murein DD-endopeptidase MepM/ murein hydrolase activator NlpD
MRRRSLLFVMLPAWLVAGCSLRTTSSPEDCIQEDYSIGTASVPDSAPFRYPLDQCQPGGAFQAHHSSGVFKNKFHAAEDCAAEPGTPVYAIADGVISYSGPMGGYGWLIVVDHPEHHVYSLYGHLSPRRWKRETGVVKKGELIAHIGDSDENGSSRKYGQIYPHLHFGVREGERADFPRWGDGRWQAGWTRACPGTIGWLSPSRFIDSLTVHSREKPSESASPAFRRSKR